MPLKFNLIFKFYILIILKINIKLYSKYKQILEFKSFTLSMIWYFTEKIISLYFIYIEIFTENFFRLDFFVYIVCAKICTKIFITGYNMHIP